MPEVSVGSANSSAKTRVVADVPLLQPRSRTYSTAAPQVTASQKQSERHPEQRDGRDRDRWLDVAAPTRYPEGMNRHRNVLRLRISRG
jgi:hypothetical protein